MEFSIIGTVEAVRGKASAFFNPSRVEGMDEAEQHGWASLHQIIEAALAVTPDSETVSLSLILGESGFNLGFHSVDSLAA